MNSKKILPETIRVIDSHTGGEPTRVVIENGPFLGSGSMQERVDRFQTSFDHFRTAVINEPRGSDVIVGALPVDPSDSTCATGVIFFNNASYLGMCGHGTIGLMVTLLHLGRIELGESFLETRVGKVKTIVHDRHRVTVENVPSYRFKKSVTIDVDGFGSITGDVAWGGNWFFLVDQDREVVEFENLERLDQLAKQIRRTLERNGITGVGGAAVDHIEIFGPTRGTAADSRNFVLCPGGAYDRSPCGTGTSAKLACLAADGKLAPGQIWRQASILGSVFEASYQALGDQVVPRITGSAYLCADVTMRFDPDDPFYTGICQ